MRPGTVAAKKLWCGDRRFTPRTASLVKKSRFMDDPRFRFYPVPEKGVRGWDDEFNKLRKNGGGKLKSVAELGFAWLLHTLGTDQRRWIVFSGGVGMGKTHLACVLGAYWIQRVQQPGKIVVWAEFLDGLRHKIELDKAGRPIPDRLLDLSVDSLIHTGFLVLDDVSVGRSVFTDWAIDQLWIVLHGRIGKPTILTMNTTREDYQEILLASKFDAAQKIADRLGTGLGGNVVTDILFESPYGSYRKVSP